jgi:hypothetical protein
MDEHEHRSEEEATDEQAADVVEDLDVPEGQQADVEGGFKQGWPIKIEPPPGG